MFTLNKMPSIPDNVRQALITLVPASLINEISCFIFYDHHPRDKNIIDVTICTFRGEVKEFYLRELVSSVVVEGYSAPGSIITLRSNKCELFYLLTFSDEIRVISRTNKLQILHRVSNVYSYDIEDPTCSGKVCLKIVRKDDAVPLVFDDNFDKLKEKSATIHKKDSKESSPILTQLARKLTEAKFSVKCNEKVCRDLMNLRQLTTYSSFMESCSSTDAVFQENKEGSLNALSIKTPQPWIKISNNQIVVIMKVSNNGIEPIQDIHFILQNDTHKTIVYTTKLYEGIKSSPYWREKHFQSLKKGETKVVVLVIPLKELQYDITSRIDLNGVLCYKMKSKEYLTTSEKIILSSLDIMGEKFDVLSNIQKEETTKYNILSLLAASKKTGLSLRYIKKGDNANDLNLLHLFCLQLGMEKVKNSSNIVAHLKCPHHILYGVAIVQETEEIGEGSWIISLYTRSDSQILAFIHYMHDAIPYRIIATTTYQKMCSKQPQLSHYNEDTSNSPTKLNCLNLIHSVMNQSSLTLQYLDECMIKMNESKSPKVLSKIGSEIDVFAGGPIAFKEFRSKMFEEEKRHISQLGENQQQEEEFEGMVIDVDDKYTS